MLLTCLEMQALEKRAFSQGISAEALMEEAGEKIAAAVRQFCPVPGRCVVHFGKGHNGGDALVAARHLAAAGWRIEPVPAFDPKEWSALTAKKFADLREPASAAAGSPLVVLDGLLGIGAAGPLREPIRTATRAINALRSNANSRVFSIDLPTGLNADDGSADPDTVRADFTLTIGAAKRGLVADAATAFVGRLAVLELEELSARAESGGDGIATASLLLPVLPVRRFDVHKGDFGRIAVVAGSRGLTGAALMTSEACVRAGAGLVTLYVTNDIYPIAAAASIPEVMVRPVDSYLELLKARHDVVAIGPGLGSERHGEILELIRQVEQPMIIDADALNALAAKIETLNQCKGPRLLTPHPGEMGRLDPASAKLSRKETVESFTGRYPHTLLLKGARTLIGGQGRNLSYNCTGSPGMASGGMGDVLTGICAALAGHGLPLYDAARAGAWLSGRAAELAIYDGNESEESFSATALLAHLGAAFKQLRAGCY